LTTSDPSWRSLFKNFIALRCNTLCQRCNDRVVPNYNKDSIAEIALSYSAQDADTGALTTARGMIDVGHAADIEGALNDSVARTASLGADRRACDGAIARGSHSGISDQSSVRLLPEQVAGRREFATQAG